MFLKYNRNVPETKNWGKAQKRIHKRLANNHNIVIVRPDKGHGVVIMDKTEYISKINSILGDPGKFSHVTDDIYRYNLKREIKVRDMLLLLKKDGKISASAYSSMVPCGTKPAQLFGLPKIHKENTPLRPIMAAVGTLQHKLSKILQPVLAHLSKNEYSVLLLCVTGKTVGCQNVQMSSKPLYYRRYVDDTFIIFKDEKSAYRFYEYLNNQHQNISYTMEKEQGGCLPFLDIMVKKGANNSVSTDVFFENLLTQDFIFQIVERIR